MGAPRRFVTIIEGESLINDATALTLYKVAVAATLCGGVLGLARRRLLRASPSAAGILIGRGGRVACSVHVRRVTEDTTTEITISLLTPYFAYLPAEALGASAGPRRGSGSAGARPAPLDPDHAPAQAFSFWETLSLHA